MFHTDDPEDEEEDEELEILSASSVSSTTDSDSTLAEKNQRNMKDVSSGDPVKSESFTEVHFPSDSTAASMKDLVRHVIRKATQAVAIVMDRFSDVELLCDLLEASRKRNVSVHLLLDRLHLGLFLGMWRQLKLNSKDFPKVSVRSVLGETYCAKTGRKLPGQVAESFIITDWTAVLTGSFSFSWLHWQVHRSLLVVLRGGSVVAPFLQEFHRLHSSSQPAAAGFVSFIAVPDAARAPSARRNRPTRERESYPRTAVCQWLEDAAAWTVSHGQTEARSVCVKPPVWLAARNSLQSVPVHSRVRLDQTPSSVRSQLAGLAINASDLRNGRVPERQAAQYQFRRSEGLSFQQRVRNLLAKPLGTPGGLAAPSGQKAELSSSASQHKPSASSFCHPRRPELQTKPHFQPQRGSRPAPAGPPLGPQLHADPKRPHPGPRAKPPFQRAPLEQTYGWSPQGKHAAAAAAQRQNSFSCSRGAAAAAPGWRPLPRSRSMPERRTAAFRRVQAGTHRATALQGYSDDWTH
uniref:Scaffolding anchor of CK1 domain-containing protein n=1 Tax=Salarias fasciatus TaxID=181472 RepID=A0A672FNI1_SALFA